MTPPPPPRDPPPLTQGNAHAEAPPPPGTSPLAPREPHIRAAFVPAGQKILMSSHKITKPGNNGSDAAYMTLGEQQVKNHLAKGVIMIGALVKSLEEVPTSKGAIQLGKQTGSNEPAIE